MTEPENSPVATCPRGHLAPQVFPLSEIEPRRLRGSLRFYCAQCDAFWEPTEREIEELKPRKGRAPTRASPEGQSR